MSEDEQQPPPHCPTCQCQVLECIEQILDEASQQLADFEDSPGEEQRHRDILAGWQWVAELSERTCASCVAMHGTIHPLDEPGPLDHQQGRCTRTPVTKTWKQLGFEGIDEPEGFAKPGDGEKWLAKQPEDVQRHILGNRGLEAWQAGAWPSSQWARRRTTDGWRDSYTPARPPEKWRNDARQIETRKKPRTQKEKLFKRKFERTGEKIAWLPEGGFNAKGGQMPSNDFRWDSHNGKEYELKSPKAKYGTVANAIRSAVKEARENHDFTKDRFMIDLGDKALTLKLRNGLRAYNKRNPDNRISELWVFNRGDLEKIDLI